MLDRLLGRILILTFYFANYIILLKIIIVTGSDYLRGEFSKMVKDYKLLT